MRLIGEWLEPKEAETPDQVSMLQDFINNQRCICAFCGCKTRLTAQTPLGYFNVCVANSRVPDEPVNWVPLCVVCSDLNSLQNLKGKGSFIEAPWISQSSLINVLKASYFIALTPESSWGSYSKASEAFLRKIDAPPASLVELGWDGSVEPLEHILEQALHPFEKASYLNSLRFRFDLEPYEDALRYWAVSVAHQEHDLTDGDNESEVSVS